MKCLLIVVVLMMAVGQVQAQNVTAKSDNYKTAIGVKVWDGAGANLKTFVGERSALELIGFFCATAHASPACMNTTAI